MTRFLYKPYNEALIRVGAMHFFLYGFSIFIYTAGVFIAGLFVGQWLERVWIADQQGPAGRPPGPKASLVDEK